MKKIFLYCCFLNLSICFAQVEKGLLDAIENNIYTNKDSVSLNLEKVYAEADTNNKALLGFKGAVLASVSSDYFRDFEIMQKRLYAAENYLNRIPKEIDTLTDGPTAYRIYYNHYRAHYHFVLHDIPTAKKYYLKTLSIIEDAQKISPENVYADYITSTNSFLALIYQREYKYDIAVEFYNENLRILREQEKDSSAIYEVKNLIASLYSDQEDYERSNRITKKSISYYMKDGVQNNPNSFRSTSLLLIGNYIDQNQIDSAQYYLNTLSNTVSDKGFFTSDFNRFRAVIAQGKGESDKAVLLYKTVIDSFKVNGDTADEQSRTYRDLGKAYFSLGSIDKAIDAYDESLSFFIPGRSKADSLKRPAYRMFNLFETLKVQSQLFNTQKRYEETLKNGQITVEKLNDYKRSFNDDQDKQYLVDNVLPIFEACVEATYQLYLQSNNDKYLEEAFNYFELSKSPILMDALYRNSASNFRGVPAALIDQEKLLKRSISLLENQIATNKNQEKVSRLFDLKKEREQLIKQIETKYPAYYELKYSSETASLSKFQEQMGETTVLSYYYGSEALYILTVNSKEILMDRILLSRKRDLNIPKLNELLSNPKSDAEEIAQLSNTIYKTVIPKSIQTADNKKLLIMPDGLLHTFPFEILSTDGSNRNLFIKKHLISYVNSATLWTRLQGFYKNKKPLLAFAPKFSGTTNGFKLLDLPSNEREVTAINSYFQGAIYTGQDATLSRFEKEAGQYSLLHLATHAVTNDEVPEYSFLAFANAADRPADLEGTKEAASILYINDLYLEEIHANLVTLSACQTGVGTIEKGEGMISLSRAFFYGGAKSIVYSLWNTNDYSTYTVITDFYKNLSEGSSKDMALQQAKLNFIETNQENKLSHPYYWSSFVVNGNSQPIVSKHTWKWWYLLPALLVLILLYKPLLKLLK